MQVQVAREHGAHVVREAQRVQHGQQVEEGHVQRIREPRLYWYRVVCKNIFIYQFQAKEQALSRIAPTPSFLSKRAYRNLTTYVLLTATCIHM